jgi:quercetin dioxygenase-like cupin family protein
MNYGGASMADRAWIAVALLVLLCLAGPGSSLASPPAGEAGGGVVRPLNDAKFTPDEDVECLSDALENGDPDTGPSTFLLKGDPGCDVPAHYHTAEEQLIVIRGSVWTAMSGMHGALLTAGGVAVMPGKAVHWFSCRGKTPCLMVVTFDRRYDIVWVKKEGERKSP